MSVQTTFVNPPYPAGAHQHPAFIPLGIGYLAAMLEKNNYPVDVIDAQALGLTYAEVENELQRRKPDIVGVTSTTLTYKSALRIFEAAKKIVPDCLTVYGGCHATFWDEEALTECPQLDVVARGEGENTLIDLVKKKRRTKIAAKSWARLVEKTAKSSRTQTDLT